MGILYGLVRAFPFWGIPFGIVLIVNSGRASKHSKKRALVVLLLGFTLIGLSVLFFMKRGHETAVPFVYEILNSHGP